MAAVTPVIFAEQLLSRLGLPVTENNVRALVAFQHQEGGHENGASFNPLNTMLKMPGSVNFKTKSPGTGVQAYRSWDDGIEATARTMSQGNMRAIYDSLRASASPQTTVNVIGNSLWGWWDPKKGFASKLPHGAADAIVSSEGLFHKYGGMAYSGAGAALGFVSRIAKPVGIVLLVGLGLVGITLAVAKARDKRAARA